MSALDDLPETVRIGPIDVPFSIEEKLDGDDDWGEYNHGINIRLKQSHPGGPFLVDTVLHEIMHGIWRFSALEDGDKEERVISVLASGITQVLRDNPLFLRWVLKQLK